jgi:hypothetical protein
MKYEMGADGRIKYQKANVKQRHAVYASHTYSPVAGLSEYPADKE